MGHGTGKMIELFGTGEQKELFVKKLYTGEWGGTMLLTEAEAGSDVGALTTAARRNADGTYSLTGNKIFITNGDHDLTENIIHPVLARVEGAPGGTRGTTRASRSLHAADRAGSCLDQTAATEPASLRGRSKVL